MRLLLARILLAADLSALTACQPSCAVFIQRRSSPSTAANTASQIAQPPRRDLSQDEASGGHVLRKHVGRSDAELRERLEQERTISGTSTYTDRATAERAIGAAIAQSQGRIERWLEQRGHPNLVLDYDSPEPLGRTINRGEGQARSCSHALVVLKYKPPSGYYVLTSYPECR